MDGAQMPAPFLHRPRWGCNHPLFVVPCRFNFEYDGTLLKKVRVIFNKSPFLPDAGDWMAPRAL